MNRPWQQSWWQKVALGFLLSWSMGPTTSATETHTFLLFKPGDESARPQLAGDFLTSFAEYLERNINGLTGEVHGAIANRHDAARELLRGEPAFLVLAPVGFFLSDLEPLGARAILEVPRFGLESDRYTLVGSAHRDPGSKLAGTIAFTSFSPDIEYLQRVVLPSGAKPAPAVVATGAENLADEMFMLIEGATEASSVLLDGDLEAFFRDDEMVWPELEVIWQSRELPRDLVVVAKEVSTELEGQILEGLLGMVDDPEGKELLTLMSSEGFRPVDRPRLDLVTEQYRASQ